MELKASAHLPQEILTWGVVTELDKGPLTAGESCTLSIETVLAKDLSPGLSVEVWLHFVSDMDFLQCDDPLATAHFSCQGGGVECAPYVMRGAVHGPGAFFPYRRMAGVKLPAGAAAGSRLVLRMANVSMQTYEETLFNIRLAILRDGALIGYLGDAFYTVVGAEASTLRIVAPTCVERGRPFEAKIVVCDRYGNKTGQEIDQLKFEVSLKCGPGTLSPGVVTYDAASRLHAVGGLKLDADGVYYLSAAVGGRGDLRGESNPVVVRQAWPEKIFWGDIHQHTYLSDGRGTPRANYEYAVSTACLDFCAVTPHEERTFNKPLLHMDDPRILPQKGWEELVEATEAYNGPRLTTILGSEAGSLNPVAGHMNAYYLDSSNRPELERLRAPLADATYGDYKVPSYLAYLEELERSKGEFLLLPHAHAGGGPGKFDLPKRPEYQTNVEIVSVHGVFEEFYHQWLAAGHLVGVHGAGDNHMTSTGNGNPGRHYPNTNGLTGATAPRNDRRAIWDAIKNRRTVAVTGNQRIFMEFTVDGRPMGSILPRAAGPRRIQVSLAGTAPVLKVELFKNNRPLQIYRPQIDACEYFRLVWTDDFCSRRPDDSMTTGSIRAAGGVLELLRPLNAYNRSDRFGIAAGAIEFRANGYSGVTRGVLAKAGGPGPVLLEIHDRFLDRSLLDETFTFDRVSHSRQSRPLNVEARHIRPVFTRQGHHPHFHVEMDWVDPAWPTVVQLDWEDVDDTADFYYVRAEQIDGNIIWSSPVWLR